MEENISEQPAPTDPQVQQPPMPEPKKSLWKNKWVLIGLGLFMLVFLISGAYLFGKNSSPVLNKDVVIDSPTINTTPSPTTSPISSDKLEDLGNNLVKFFSPSLAITFTYQKAPDIRTFRKDNIVCITYDKNDENCEKGQYVEILSKKSDQMLATAIKENHLMGYSEEKCFVKRYSEKDKGTSTFAGISYPINPADPGPWFSGAKNCPEKYSETNGNRYFMADSKFPNKYAFFNIGQYAIMGDDNNNPWQDTFQFTK